MSRCVPHNPLNLHTLLDTRTASCKVMRLARYFYNKLKHAIVTELLDWLKNRALVLPSDVREMIARDYDVPRELVEHIEARLRTWLIEQIEQWLQRM